MAQIAKKTAGIAPPVPPIIIAKPNAVPGSDKSAKIN